MSVEDLFVSVGEIVLPFEAPPETDFVPPSTFRTIAIVYGWVNCGVDPSIVSSGAIILAFWK